MLHLNVISVAKEIIVTTQDIHNGLEWEVVGKILLKKQDLFGLTLMKLIKTEEYLSNLIQNL